MALEENTAFFSSHQSRLDNPDQGGFVCPAMIGDFTAESIHTSFSPFPVGIGRTQDAFRQ